MNALLISLICAAVGIVPLLIGTEFITAAILGTIYFFIGLPLIYSFAPSAAYPMFGVPGVIALVWMIVSSFFDVGFYTERTNRTIRPFGWILPAGFIAIMLIKAISYSSMFSATDYAAMLGETESRVWTQDIQPKDPKHMLMGSVENALYQADKALGQAGSIGSQFQVDRESVTLQKINERWYYIVPLEYRGFSIYWSGADGIPAYIKVSAEDPNRQAELIELKNKMRFAPSSYFGTYLARHMRNNGYVLTDMYEFLFEIDEEGNPWWVVPVFKPTLGWWGERIVEIAQIDPATGKITPIKPDEVPVWMDRAFPGQLARDYITWNGYYKNGWWNTWWGATDLSIGQKSILIYGADGEPYWVTGVTSDNGQDNSLIKLAYSDARTGKTVFYEIGGGLTEEAVLGAVDNNEKIRFRQLHGVNPQLYNCYGTMASVVPLLNSSHIFQGVAIVDIMNPQRIAVGDNQEQALRQYQRLLEQNGQQIAIDNSTSVAELDGMVDRIGYDFASGVYYLKLYQLPGHLLTLDATEHPELPLTLPGDNVHVRYEDSGEKVMPVVGFSNLNIPLEGTAEEAAVREQADSSRQAEQVKNAAPTVQEDLKKKLEGMTPEELQQLQQIIKK